MKDFASFVRRSNPVTILRDTYSASMEGGALLWLRLGFTHFGIAIPWCYQQQIPLKLSRRLPLPLLRIDLAAHTGQLDQVLLLNLTILGFSLGWLTVGDTKDPAYSDRERGFVFGWRKRF